MNPYHSLKESESDEYDSNNVEDKEISKKSEDSIQKGLSTDSNKNIKKINTKDPQQIYVKRNDLEKTIEEGWVYQDPASNVMGPYSSATMREWLDRHYIDGSLLIRPFQQDVPFSSISSVFPDLSLAFTKNKLEKSKQPFEVQKPKKNDVMKAEKKITTLFSFSVDNKEDETLESWENIDLNVFK